MSQRRSPGASLWWLYAITAALYGLIASLGRRYALDVPVADRPLLLVLGLYLSACVVYFVALRQALAAVSTSRLGWWIVGTSVTFRAILLPTPPYQEIDIYRYLWDGAVVAAGEDPYVYPPGRVVSALEAPVLVAGDERLARIVRLADDSVALGEIVRTVHYGELPSPYPPVSQAVFAGAASTSSGEWSASGRLVWLKAWLVMFDIATLLVVFDLLRLTGMPTGWAVAYGWCPLVLKEVAGSGHLDAIATFFAVAALALAVRTLQGRRRWASLAAAAMLGLGVGAKLFPVLLAPLLAVGLWRRYGVGATAGPSLAFLGAGCVALAPMLWPAVGPSTEPVALAQGVESIPPPPGVAASDAATSKSDGLAAFLAQWEMNDLLFMVVYENVRSQAGVPVERTPWFDLTPESWSTPYVGRDAAAFKATRALTLVVFAVISLTLAWRAGARLDGLDRGHRGWLRAAFLTLAWFWLLAPTQNPWYWCWAVPLLPWAGGRAWVAVSMAVFAYYLRFVLESRFPDPPVLGTPYGGEYFFYFVTPWLEFGPIFIWLLVEWWRGDHRPNVVRRTDAPGAGG